MSLMLLAASCNKQRPENLQNIEATPELQAALFDLYPEAQDVNRKTVIMWQILRLPPVQALNSVRMTVS